VSPPDNNLPFQLTSLVGREREISEVEGLLAEARLLTLTGPGGSGKTRLALAVVSEVIEDYEDGSWLVELAPLSDPELVAQAVASALSVREEPSIPLVKTLADYLAPRSVLLVMDNCEHLVQACAELTQALLRSCPDLRILATSREALGVPGETLFAVPPLSLPDPRHLPVVEGLPQYEAARLFVERARAVRPDFALTERNAVAVAQVCYRLDGIPLAIELAAARTKVLSVEQISGRLKRSFGMLSSGGRTAMPHHRTLRATMEWSHGLLSKEERALFRRLAVFAGGFMLEAAEDVCAGEDLKEDEVLEVLSHLVDKSLVLVDQQDGEMRYRLLETVRQYASEKLKEAGEEAEVSQSHAAYHLALAEVAEPGLKGARPVAWLKRLEAEHDNLRAALGWALESGKAELGLRLAGTLGGFWLVRGHLSEGRRWLEAALDNRDEAPEPMRVKVLVRAGLIAREQGDYERSAALIEESLALARRLGDKVSVAIALKHLGWAALLRNELERASELSQEAVALQREMNDEVGVTHALTVLGLVAIVQRDYERAMVLHEESLALAREAEDDIAISLSLMAGSLAFLGRGDHRRATELCGEGLELSWRLKMTHPTASHLYIAASLAGSQGQSIRSARLWGAAESLLDTIGSMLAPVERQLYEPYIAAARERLGELAWKAAWLEGQAMSPEQAIEYALETPELLEEPEAPPTYPAGLSAREVEVLRHVAQGMTNARIAETLFISRRTVTTHLSSVYNKIGSHSRAEATRFASEHRLL
jgi:predicted ATPase/DNA-binding NarL/FixJ family response regulator